MREFDAIVLAVALAGCGTAPQEHPNDKHQALRSGQSAFGQGFTWEWRNQNAPPAAAAVGAKPPGEANKERQEFEEWKRKNQR